MSSAALQVEESKLTSRRGFRSRARESLAGRSPSRIRF
ncbi:hypothetical protein OROMI_000789 [Orobanche minor]